MAEAFQPLDGGATRFAGNRRGDLLRLIPGVTLALFLAPIGAGLLGTWLPAFGYFPALGGSEPSLAPWRMLLDQPGLARSVWLSLTSGILATVASLALALGFVAACHDRPVFARIRRGLAPLLAVPHVAMAIGLAFLIAPSGWLPRLVSPWATGWDLPPDVATVQDPHGLSLALGLVLKEMPFLLLMTLSALERCAAAERLAVARSLGYGPVQAWFKTVLPAVYPLIRLPVYAVLAFALSVVDMALILGPATPPPLAVQVFRWANDPDLALRFPAAAGATLQLLLVVGAIGAWRLLECIAARVGRRWIAGGRRGGDGRPARRLAGGVMALAGALAGGAILSLAIWSVTRRWRYPDALPGEWSLETWQRHGDALLWTGGTTLVLGLAAAIAALILVLGCLENEQRRGVSPGTRSLWLLYAPLLVPQVGFLLGVQLLAVTGGLDGTWLALIWSHLLFVLPYVFLALAEPYRRLDERYIRTALCLGASPARVFWRIKLPMLLRPVLIALAIGFAVSVAQYLPTLFAGGGRFATLTTEAVALSGGGDRRAIAVFAFLQAALPLIGFGLALTLPGRLGRIRRIFGDWP